MPPETVDYLTSHLVQILVASCDSLILYKCVQTLAGEIRRVMGQVYHEKSFTLFLIEDAKNKEHISPTK